MYLYYQPTHIFVRHVHVVHLDPALRHKRNAEEVSTLNSVITRELAFIALSVGNQQPAINPDAVLLGALARRNVGHVASNHGPSFAVSLVCILLR